MCYNHITINSENLTNFSELNFALEEYADQVIFQKRMPDIFEKYLVRNYKEFARMGFLRFFIFIKESCDQLLNLVSFCKSVKYFGRKTNPPFVDLLLLLPILFKIFTL